MSEDSNTAISLSTPSVENNQEVPLISAPQSLPTLPEPKSVPEEQTINHNKIEPKTCENELSLTPPLLPNMKLKPIIEINDKKSEREIKIKSNQWDMFSADQDLFDTDTNVRTHQLT